MIERLQKLRDSVNFQNSIIATIFCSAILIGIETHPYIEDNFNFLTHGLEQLFLGIFVVELIIRIGAEGRRPWKFFTNNWNIFDFLIVAISFFPGNNFIVILRLVRILRILRLLVRIREAQVEKVKNKELKIAYEKLEEEKKTSENLLLNILPNLVAQRLKGGEKIIADHFDHVTVLFSDLVGFTKLSSSKHPQELVAILDEIFTGFDQLAEEHSLEKIKTIGDAYMIVSGLPEQRPDHIEALLDMALDMPKIVAEFNEKCGQKLQIRIGIHTGPVVAGVIGKKKFIYDIWGDTVNVASRMESHGCPGKINVSDSVYQAINCHYEFEKRDLIEVKGKGSMQTWFLSGKNLEYRESNL